MENIMNEDKQNEADDILKYINQLTEDEKIVLEIAKNILKSSFSIEKSIGYLSWKKNKE